MSVISKARYVIVPFLLLACGNEGGGGGTSNAQNPQCQNSCFENCLICESKSPDVCATECSSAGTGGVSGNGGATGSTGGLQGLGGSQNGTGATQGTGGLQGNGGAQQGTGGDPGNGGVQGNGGAQQSTGGVQGNGGAQQSTGGVPGTGGATSVSTTSVSFTMNSFQVPVGGESYKCQDFLNPIGKDVDVLTSESFMTAGSHHMFLFRTSQVTSNTGVFDCPSGGSEFHEYVHTAQSPQQLTSYPSGVGRYVPAAQGFRLMVHYLNPNATAITPTVTVRLDYVDTNQVSAHAAGIFLNDMSIAVGPGTSAKTFNYTMPNYAFKLLGGASHMHKRGVGFHANTSTGGVIYDIPNPTPGAWDEPAANDLSPGLDVNAGSKITVTCDYNNTTSSTYSFGDSANTNEMCIYAGAFYPAPNGTSIVQQCLAPGLCVSTLN